MGTKTGISWTSATWNPVRGCVRVSEGCRFCYAESVAARFSGEGMPYEGLAKTVTPAGGKPEARWTGAVMEVSARLEDPLRWRNPKMIFANSMSDLFYERISLEWVDKCVAVMGLAQHHTFQVLTKRADRMRDYLNDPAMPDRVLAAARFLKPSALWNGNMYQLERYFEDGRALPNVWWGVSAENQEAANERIPALLDAKAAVRFVSYEPALGPIDFQNIVIGKSRIDALRGRYYGRSIDGDVPALDWIIIGGESHKDWRRARPFDLRWAEALVRASQEDGVTTAVFVKQLGSHPITPLGDRISFPGKADQPDDFHESIRVQNFPEAANAHPS